MGGGPNKAFHHIQIDVEDMKWWPINKNSKILWSVDFLFFILVLVSSVEFSIHSFSSTWGERYQEMKSSESSKHYENLTLTCKRYLGRMTWEAGDVILHFVNV